MGCLGRDSEKAVSEDQKWAYITLSDFRSKSCFNGFSYAWLWILTLISIGVIGADIFTCVNLLAFDNWSSQVKPVIPFTIAKWIFAIAILISFVILAIEWILTIRALRRGGVVDSYMEPLAVIVQSIRPGSGQGFRRFLVFSELTKSKKGVNYIALFVYFQFKGALRVLVAEGPRVVINGMTLWSVMKLQLIPEGEHQPEDGRSKFAQFFVNIKALADSNNLQAVILSSMLFTLVIWVFEILFLFISIILYILFLWHHIPSSDGSLARYCRRKIESRLERIVSTKVQKAIAKGEAKRIKQEQKAAKKEDRPLGGLSKQPTLPVLGHDKDDTKSHFTLERQDSISSLPSYSSRPPTANEAYDRPGMGSRTITQSSGYSAHSDAPLLDAAGPMGYGEPGRASPAPALPPLDRLNQFNHQGRSWSPATRPGTANSGYGPPGMRPPPRSNSAFSSQGRNSPVPRNMPPRLNSNVGRRTPGPSPMADPSWSPYDEYSTSQHGPAYEMSPVETSSSDAYSAHTGPPPSLTPGPPSSISATPLSLTPGPQRQDSSSVPPQRNFASPLGQPTSGYRSASAAPPVLPVASQRQGQGAWFGGARVGGGQFRN